jgi:hypothetical protein
MNRNLNDDEILEEVEKGSSNIDNNKLDLIVKGEEEIKRKSSRLDGNLPGLMTINSKNS